MKKLFLGMLFLGVLNLGVLYSSEDSMEKLRDEVIFFKENYRGNLLLKVRSVQRRFKDVVASGDSDGVYYTALRDQAAQKVRLCEIIGVGADDYGAEDIGGKSTRVCLSSKARIRKAALAVHPDKVASVSNKADLTMDQQGIFLRALQQAYAKNYGGLLLKKYRNPDHFNIDTLFEPDQVAADEDDKDVNPGNTRIQNLAKYIIGLIASSTESIEKTEDPKQTVVTMIDDFNDFFGPVDYIGNITDIKLSKILDGIRKSSLAIESVAAYEQEIEKIISDCLGSDSGIGAIYAGLVNSYKKNSPEARTLLENQGYIESVIIAQLRKLQDFLRRYKAILSDSSGSAYGDESTGGLSDLGIFVSEFEKETRQLAIVWDENSALGRDHRMQEFGTLFLQAQNDVVGRALEVESDPSQEAANQEIFERAVALFKQRINDMSLMNIVESRSSVSFVKDRLLAWINLYKDIINYIAVNIYHTPEPFAKTVPVDPKITDLLVDLTQTLRIVGA